MDERVRCSRCPGVIFDDYPTWRDHCLEKHGFAASCMPFEPEPHADLPTGWHGHGFAAEDWFYAHAMGVVLDDLMPYEAKRRLRVDREARGWPNDGGGYKEPRYV